MQFVSFQEAIFKLITKRLILKLCKSTVMKRMGGELSSVENFNNYLEGEKNEL